jgi:hypothetical protein
VAKKCFLSFYYKEDSWRVQTVKNIGSIEEQPILDGNKWEEIRKKGDAAVKQWIEDNMRGKECLVVLIGSHTSGRRWVKHEIQRACEKGIGVCGVYIHKLKDSDRRQSVKGSSPFAGLTHAGKSITSFAREYDPPQYDSQDVYEHIANNIASWVDTAISLRKYN